MHDQKRQRGVDALLVHLWEPILWRSLRVANPNVRKNAAMIFVEAFPLQDPKLPAVELDALLQMQFDSLQRLLRDDAVSVRVVATHGACRILALYWELIPPITAKALLTAVVRDLAHDAAANTVRIAALAGVQYLLTENSSATCIAMLSGVLHHLKHLIHDGSERVRAAFVELCLVLSKVCPPLLCY